MVFGLKRPNLFPGFQGENSQIVWRVFIGGIDPVLIKFVGTGASGIQPNRSLFGFAEFGAVRFFDQGGGDGEGLATVHTAYQLRPG